MLHVFRSLLLGAGLSFLATAVFLADAWVMWTALAVCVALALVLGAKISAERAHQRRQANDRAIREGRFGVVRVDAIRRLGSSDGETSVLLYLTAVIGRNTFRTTVRRTLDALDAALFTRGSRHVALLLDEPRPELKILDDLDALELEQALPMFDPEAVQIPEPSRVPEWSVGRGARSGRLRAGVGAGGGAGVGFDPFGTSTSGLTTTSSGTSTSAGSSHNGTGLRGIASLLAFALGLGLVAYPNAHVFAGAAQLAGNALRGIPNSMLLTDPEALATGISELRAIAPTEDLQRVTIYGTTMTAEIMLAGSTSQFDKYTYGVPGIPFQSGAHREGEGYGSADEPFTFDQVPWHRVAEFRETAIRHATAAGFTDIEDAESTRLRAVLDQGFLGAPLNISFYFETRDTQFVTLDMDGTVIGQYPSASELADPAAHTDLTADPDLVELAWEEIMAIAPTTTADSVLVFQSYLIADLRTSDSGAEEWDEYMWRPPTVWGTSGASHQGPAAGITSSSGPFDATTVPWKILPELAETSLSEAGLSRDDLPHGVWIRIDRGVDDPEPKIRVSFSTDRDHYQDDYTFAGTPSP
ncbi:MAG TPA: hypothetical protein GX743_00445 [Actinomycetales bacterium]|nr:hypothetical protein [Actinomycetales bacterium]